MELNDAPVMEEVKRGFKRTEVGVIPEDWDCTTLGELGKFKNGINKAKEEFGHGSPFINLMDVFGISSIGGASHLGLVSSSSGEQQLYNLVVGDVLFVRSSVKHEGVGLTTVVVEDLPNTVFSGFLLRFRTSDRLTKEYKLHCFGQAAFRSRLIGSSTVSANTNINQSALRTLSLAFPRNRTEQRAIATALTEVDGLLGSLDALIAKKQAIKQGAMQQLLTGNQRLPGFTGEWGVMRLGEVVRFQVGCPFSSTYFNEKSVGLRLVKNRDLKADDQVFHYDGPYEKAYLIANDDVLIGMDGDFLPCRWNKGVALLNQRVGRLVVTGAADRIFLYYFLLDSLKEIENMTSSTTVKHLSHGDVEGIEKPLPTKEEQTAIATVLSDMDAEIGALAARRAKTALLKQGMMQELLTGRVRLV